MSDERTEIDVSFEESPPVEIHPIRRTVEKRKISWLAWLR
jgi:hypothetical protein